MKKLSLFLLGLLICQISFAAQSVTWRDGGGDELGTSSNPVYVNGAGGASSTLDITAVYATGLKVNNLLTSNMRSLVTYNGNQYVGFWDSNGNLVLGKRTLPNGIWTNYVYDGTGGRATIGPVTNDNHNGIALGIDPNGFIHVSYDMHNDPLNYRKSSSAEDVSGLGSEISMLGTNETQVAYPDFFNDRNGVLYFQFRDGGASNGDHYVYKYDHAGTTWGAALGTTAGKLTNGKSSSLNAYITTPYVDSNNFAHWWWDWRDGSGENNVQYMKCDLATGTFTKSTGAAQTIPATNANDENVVVVAGDGLEAPIGRRAIGVDSTSTVFITYARNDANGNIQIWYTKNSGSGWLTPVQLTQSPAVPASGTPVTNAASDVVRVPILLIDSSDKVYIIFKGDVDGVGMNVLSSSDSGTTWKKFSILGNNMGTTYPGNFDMRGWDANNEFYNLLQFGFDRTITYTRQPVFLLHWIPSEGGRMDEAISYGHVNYDDYTVGSKTGWLRFYGHVIYDLSYIRVLTQTDDIETEITNAATGSILLLPAGTIVVASTIDITKSIFLVGQGNATTLTSSAATTALFSITVPYVTLEGFNISTTAAGTFRAIYYDRSATTVDSASTFKNMNITMSGTGSQFGIHFKDSGGTVENCKITTTSSNGASLGVYATNGSTAEAAAVTNVYRTVSTNVGASGNTISYVVQDSTSSFDSTLNIYNSIGTASGAGTDIAMQSDLGANAKLNAYFCVLNGGNTDALQATSGVLTLYNCTLVNNTTSGTITLGGTIQAANIGLGGTLTSSATGSLGWVAVAGANTACNTTCTSACVFGLDLVTGLLTCTDATADTCICAGAS